MTTPLGGKATTLTPVEVTTDPNTSVQLLDKDGRVIGSGTTGANGRVTITPTRPIPEGNVTAKATDNAEHPNSSTSDPVKATDTTPPTKPRVTTPLGGKATTLTPIEVHGSKYKCSIIDKDGRVIGSGTTGANGRVTITQLVLFRKVMSLPRRLIMQNVRIVLRLIRSKRRIRTSR